eukprot:13746-Heterococcus_DN1.PRE.4
MSARKTSKQASAGQASKGKKTDVVALTSDSTGAVHDVGAAVGAAVGAKVVIVSTSRLRSAGPSSNRLHGTNGRSCLAEDRQATPVKPASSKRDVYAVIRTIGLSVMLCERGTLLRLFEVELASG